MATATLFANSRQEVLIRVLRKMAELQAEVNNLLLAEHGATSKEYSNMDIADALVRYLTERGGEAEYLECENALLQRGCDLRSRPRAVLRTVITRNPNLFEWRGVRVGKVTPKIQPQRVA